MRFEYHSPASIQELTDMLAHWSDRARVLAGGQTLIPALNQRICRTDHLIDIAEVAGVDWLVCDRAVSVGARCRQRDLETHSRLVTAHPLLAEALPLIGDPAVRSRGTVCGSLAAADPAAELPAVALTAGATLHVRSKRGCRDLRAEDFYLSSGGTVLQKDEFLAGVSFDDWSPNCLGAIEELRYTAMSFSAAGVAVLLAPCAGQGATVRITVFGQGIPAQRMTDAESLFEGERITASALDGAMKRTQRQLLASEVPGIPAAYAAQLAGTLVRRALARAAATAGLWTGPEHEHAIESH